VNLKKKENLINLTHFKHFGCNTFPFNGFRCLINKKFSQTDKLNIQTVTFDLIALGGGGGGGGCGEGTNRGISLRSVVICNVILSPYANFGFQYSCDRSH